MSDEFTLVEESPGAAPHEIINVGRPSSHLSVATRFHIKRLGLAVGMRVRCPVDARTCIDLTYVT
jgi:hypothetical protein